MKQCNTCKEWKDESEYWHDKTKKDGYATSCIVCRKKAQKPYIPKPFVSVGDIRSVRDEQGRKYCEKCKQWKVETEFNKNKNQKDGYYYICRSCSYTPKVYKSPLLIRNEQGQKQCSKCKQWKEESEFAKVKQNSDGLCGVCKLCVNLRNLERYKKIKYNLEFKEQREGQKQCTNCKQWKPIEEYGLNIRAKDGHNCRCKQCITEWREKNKEQIVKYNKEYRTKNKDKLQNYHKKYYEDNKEYFNNYFKNYREENIEYLKEYDKTRNKENKLNRCISRGIWHSIRHNKAGQHWENLVPYTLQQLKEHLESQFTPLMSWSNYGTYWEIDHIIPQNLFNISSPDDSNFRICWSLVNLRPLEKSLNRQRPKDGSDVSEEVKKRILRSL